MTHTLKVDVSATKRKENSTKSHLTAEVKAVYRSVSKDEVLTKQSIESD